jgi:hypothetical protein
MEGSAREAERLERFRLSIIDLETRSMDDLSIAELVRSLISSLDDAPEGPLLSEILLLFRRCFSKPFNGAAEFLDILLAGCRRSLAHFDAFSLALHAHVRFLNPSPHAEFCRQILSEMIDDNSKIGGFDCTPGQFYFAASVFLDITPVTDIRTLTFALRTARGPTHQGFDRIFGAVDCALYRRLFDTMGHDEFVKLISPQRGIIPSVIASKLNDFGDTLFFLSHLEKPHLYLDDESMAAALMQIRDRAALVRVLRPTLCHRLILERRFWDTT